MGDPGAIRMTRLARAGAIAAISALAAASVAWNGRMHGDDRARNARRAGELAAIERDVGAIVERARGDAWLPGVSAAFVLPDGRVGAAAAGRADLGTDARMTPDTRFLAGSVGKSLHAALAVALARDGVIDLDAPISRWIGDEPWFARLPNGRDLTLRRLLQHQSGMIDHLYSVEFLARELGLRMSGQREDVIPPEQLIEIALDRRPKFRAGEGFKYSDTNYVLAGYVIERATRRSPFVQIEERFLRPLGLTSITPARARRIPRLANGYQLPVNPFLLPWRMLEKDELPINPMIEGTAGGFAATPRDLARWAKALFEARALPARAVREMTTRSVATGDGRDYGLGVYRTDTPLGEAWGHGGYFPGYRSELLYFPDSRIAVAVEVNRDFAVDVHALLLEIAERVRGDLMPSSRSPHRSRA
jgi:D-alanyl-D-alanine carboxypeptidase